MKKLIGVIVVVLFAATLGFGQAKVVATEWQVPFLNCLDRPYCGHWRVPGVGC